MKIKTEKIEKRKPPKFLGPHLPETFESTTLPF